MAEKKFEKALEKLEAIVREMEAGELTLDESLKAFQEGIELSRFCMNKLDEAERKVEILLQEKEEIKVHPYIEEKINE
ncbi:MAG: exodeoxyribonuclease VII small subunit [Syntrophales bacterium]|jgi:exodeoxyribonuclease VII small subunit|nr:exodeoxyribonuclease VII small subunit [Syntrophales bacterium]MDY0043382.1 exodeoxyribonuclease VII small subunit [Syntrophales bacterium]